MQGHVKKDMSPEENALYEKVIERYSTVCQSTALSDFLGPMHLFITFVFLFFFLQTGIDPLAVKLENDEEDDLMQLAADA